MYGTLTIRTLVLGWDTRADRVKEKEIVAATIHGVEEHEAQRIANIHGAVTETHRYIWAVAPKELTPNRSAAVVAKPYTRGGM